MKKLKNLVLISLCALMLNSTNVFATDNKTDNSKNHTETLPKTNVDSKILSNFTNNSKSFFKSLVALFEISSLDALSEKEALNLHAATLALVYDGVNSQNVRALLGYEAQKAKLDISPDFAFGSRNTTDTVILETLANNSAVVTKTEIDDISENKLDNLKRSKLGLSEKKDELLQNLSTPIFASISNPHASNKNDHILTNQNIYFILISLRLNVKSMYRTSPEKVDIYYKKLVSKYKEFHDILQDSH